MPTICTCTTSKWMNYVLGVITCEQGARESMIKYICQCDCEQVCQHEGEGGEGECQASSKLYITLSKLWEEVVCLEGL
jgi:hypothetical protein